MKYLFLFSFFIYLNSCIKENEKKNKIYHIIKEPILEKEPPIDSTLPPPPPPPGVAYYGNYNFILYDDTTIYFHTLKLFRHCGNGIDYSKPPKLKMEANNLTQIHPKNLSYFLENSISDSIKSNIFSFACISSPLDTVKNQAFEKITNHFKSKKINRIIVRKWTEEEKFVSQAKKNNLEYDFSQIKWKVGFDEN
jgi:hypothetical protein